MVTIIFGGSFDPPHLEHKRLLKAAAEQLGAKKIVIIPTYAPYYKDFASIDFSLREKMIEATLSDMGIPVEINQIEKLSKKQGYAVDILSELKPLYQNPVYLIGGDSIFEIEKWKNYKELLKIMPIAYAERKGYSISKDKAKELKEHYGGEFLYVDFVGEDISSSVIKAKLHLRLKAPIHDRVQKIIDEENLFAGYFGKVEKLKTMQSPELFFHSIAVVLAAVDINSKLSLNLDFDKIFLSALLHDNSKEMPEDKSLDVPSDAQTSAVYHQFAGSRRAKTVFEIEDEEILSAIRYHTTAKPNMSSLEKLIYCADMLSEDRYFEELPLLKKEVLTDLDEGFKQCLKHNYFHIMKKGKKMYHLTKDAYNYYFPNDSKEANE